jgi:WD40 repeat protein
MTPHPDADLVLAYLDGELAAEQTRALEARLKTDPALAELLLILARDEAIVRDWAGCERAADEALHELLQDDQPCPPQPLVPSRNGHEEKSSPRSRGRWVVGLCFAAIAASMLAVSLLFRWPGHPTDTTPPLARLSGVQGEVQVVTAAGQVLPAVGGEELLPGQEVRTGGDGSQAVVIYPDRSRLELGPDTALRLEVQGGPGPGVGKRVYLQSGLVEAAVTRQPAGRPMILTTPHAVIRVLGTRFSSAASGEATWVELEEGQVELTRTRDGKSVLVEKDRFAVAALDDEPLVAQPLPPRITEAQTAVPAQPGQVQGLAFSPDGATLAIASTDGTLTAWDRRRGQPRWSIKAHDKRFKALAFSPDGKVLASGGMDKVIKFWDSATGTPLPISFAKQKRDIDVIAFSAENTLLATALGYGKGGKGSEQIALWDPKTGKLLDRIAGHTAAGLLTLALSPDGKTLATGFADGTIKLWDVATRRERAAFRGHDHQVYALAFSPSGNLFATAGRDRTVRLWDAQTGEARPALAGHVCEVRALAFSPDGQFLASAGQEGLVRLWDTAGGTELRAFKGHGKGGILSVAFSPDGKLLATGGQDKRVLLWAITAQQTH